jgi:hypothetical protein
MISVRLAVSMAISSVVAAAVLSSFSTRAEPTSEPSLLHVSVVAPTSPFNFITIWENQHLLVSVDPSTLTAVTDTKSGEIMKAGIFRVIRKQAKQGEEASFVVANMTICGSDLIIGFRSKSFDSTGKFMRDDEEPQLIEIKNPDSAGAAVYKVLCESNIKPTPPNPSYKAPGSYTKFWV